MVHLARAVAALGAHRFPVRRTDATEPILAALADLTGRDLRAAGDDLSARWPGSGPSAPSSRR